MTIFAAGYGAWPAGSGKTFTALKVATNRGDSAPQQQRRTNMNFNTEQFTQVVESAIAASSDKPRWQNAVRKAAEGLRNGSIVISETVACALVTTEGGSYRVNGAICECPAYRHGNQPCKHRAARRLISLYNAALMESKLDHPVETRTIEYDHCGNRQVVVRYDGWMV